MSNSNQLIRVLIRQLINLDHKKILKNKLSILNCAYKEGETKSALTQRQADDIYYPNYDTSQCVHRR